MKRLLTMAWIIVKVPALAVTLATPTFSYSTALEDRFGYYVDVLGRGYPLGHAEVSVGGKDGQVVSDFSAAMTEAQRSLQTAYDDAQKAWLKQIDDAAGSAPSKSEVVPAPSPKGALRSLSAEGLTQFDACAAGALKVLKLQLQGEEATKPDGFESRVRELDPERGDGKDVAPSGVPCGTYLGTAGAPSADTKSDVKALLALTARKSPAERRALLMAFAMEGKLRRGEPVHAGAFWRFAWQSLSFLAVFSDKPLPAFETLGKQFRGSVEAATGKALSGIASGKLQFTINASSLLESIEADRQLAENVVKGAFP